MVSACGNWAHASSSMSCHQMIRGKSRHRSYSTLLPLIPPPALKTASLLWYTVEHPVSYVNYFKNLKMFFTINLRVGGKAKPSLSMLKTGLILSLFPSHINSCSHKILEKMEYLQNILRQKSATRETHTSKGRGWSISPLLCLTWVSASG